MDTRVATPAGGKQSVPGPLICQETPVVVATTPAFGNSDAHQHSILTPDIRPSGVSTRDYGHMNSNVLALAALTSR